MKKRLLALMLASALVVSSFAACSSSTDDKESSTDKESSSTGDSSDAEDSDEPAVLTGVDFLKSKDEPVEITILFNTLETDPGRFKVFEYIKEACNVDLIPQAVSTTDFVTKVETLYLSGTGADIIGQQYPKLADVANGVLLPISDYEDQMPTYTAHIEKVGARENVDNARFYDDKYYGFPIKMQETVLISKQWSMRTDIFEKNNINIPTTMDEVYEAGVKLVELYPGSAPITNRYGLFNIISGISAAFGTIPTEPVKYDADTDSWIFPQGTQEWKDMVTYVNKLVNDGVLDEEFTTRESTAYEQMITQGETFMMFDWYSNNSKYNTVGKELDADYTVTVVDPPVGPNGDYALVGANQYVGNCVFLAGLADDEEHLAEVLAYLDWTYTDEAEILLTWGKEGESYEVQESGKIDWLGDTDYFNEWGLNSNNLLGRVHIDSLLLSTLTEEETNVILNVGADKKYLAPQPTAKVDADQYEEIQIAYSAVKDYVSISLEEFIYGKRPLDELDAFVEECNTKGAQDIVAIYNESWGE